ncbi:MAG: dephospho-CoA kinase [Flavobacteriaceae bacterium]|nr:dephospho-CoA kinase [Flavobacteriaceae bacterium]|tara:strand:- start:10973 stop:11554 length:582 start_codon:yes stop_codon:yes gene_type:complete
MKIVGLTGGIGSGKTSILNLFKKNNIKCFNSDFIAKNLMERDLMEKIKILFGSDIYIKGKLNRKKISKIVFNDKEKLSSLNSIVHPEVRKKFENFIKNNKKDKILVYETALLFETGFYKKCDFTILVIAPFEKRIQRIIKRDKLLESEIIKRMKHQWSDKKKAELSDYIINNDIWENTLFEFNKLFKKLNLAY